MTDTEILTKVAGVTFAAGYPRNLTDLVSRFTAGTIPAELHRDLDNAHDLNAVSVRIDGRHIGYLPAALAAELAPAIDAGDVWSAEALYVAVDPDHRNRPGLRLRLTQRTTS